MRADLMGDSVWVVRLTPEMKAKIKAAGLPLLSGLPFAAQMPNVSIAPRTLRDLQEQSR